MAVVNSLINVDEGKCLELNAFDVIAERGEGKNIAVIATSLSAPSFGKQMARTK